MRSTYTALVLAAALLAGSVSVFAGEDASTPPPPGMGRHSPRHEGRRGFDGSGCGMMGDRGGMMMGHRGGMDGQGMRMSGHDGFGPGALEMLQLNDAQKTKLKDVMTERFRAGLDARMELNEARQALRKLHLDGNASPEAIVAANAAVGTAMGKMEVVRMQSKSDMEAILTPEQKTTLEAWRNHGPHPRSENCQFGDACRMGDRDMDGRKMNGPRNRDNRDDRPGRSVHRGGPRG